MFATLVLLALGQVTPPPLITPDTPEAPLEVRDDQISAPARAGEPGLSSDATPRAPSVRDARIRLASLRAEPSPSLGAPIAVLAGGIGFIGVSALFAYVGLVMVSIPTSGAVLSAATAFLVIAGLAAIPGLIMTIAGVRWLVMELRNKREKNREIRALEEQIRRSPVDPVVPLGPVPSVSVPPPSLLLATF
ncbi:MAG: hypothetical protein JNM17_27085 [Archangium sp.]|nr:hypothetical protein [Archangium sp.]